MFCILCEGFAPPAGPFLESFDPFILVDDTSIPVWFRNKFPPGNKGKKYLFNPGITVSIPGTLYMHIP